MKFTAKSDYGIRALMDIAFTQSNRPVQVNDIAARQGIPERYLEQVMTALKKAGIVESIRGVQGGYRLARRADEIRMDQVVEALDGQFIPIDCTLFEKTCSESSTNCVIGEMWMDIKGAVKDVLTSQTLKDLCDRKQEKDTSSVIMYNI